MALKKINITHLANTLVFQDISPVNPGGGAQSLTMKALDDIQWCSQDGDFAVLFAKSPFQSGNLSVSATQGNCTAPERAGHLPKKIKKKFKYFVALHLGGNVPPVLVQDPDIIVDDTGGGSRPKKKAAKPKKSAPKKAGKKK